MKLVGYFDVGILQNPLKFQNGERGKVWLNLGVYIV